MPWGSGIRLQNRLDQSLKIMRILTWNLYRGTRNGHQIHGLPAATPVERLNLILDLADHNGVDIVVLQELPRGGNLPIGTIVPNGWRSATISEHDAEVTVMAASFNATYGIFWRHATTRSDGNINRFIPNQFVLLTGARLRAPVYLEMRHNEVEFTLFNWHNDTGNWANDGLQIFASRNLPTNTIIAGDFNRKRNDISSSFDNAWSHVVGVNGTIRGVDHLLTTIGDLHPTMEGMLDFVSDSNHWPLAADIY
jgi:endonuclease/exonuclease/phosphatase family metal-dependent hydrolase